MKISNLIWQLQAVKQKLGDVECVVEIEDFFGDKVYSTIEDLTKVQFQESTAIMLNWRR